MITGVTAVAPSGDGAPVRVAFSTSASASAPSADSSSASELTAAPAAAVAKPGQSPGGASTRGGDSDSSATGQYLASLLAAQITGRAPAGDRPVRITPERLSTLISYLEATVASTSSASTHEERAVDVTS